MRISTDPEALDIDVISRFLSESYWAAKRPHACIEASLQNSLVFGVYDGDLQIGMARVVSDFATFAWLCDVFVDERYRGQGISKWLLETVLAHPDLQGLKRFLLVTRDAHSLYARYGFTPLANSQNWMELSDPALRES